METVAEIEDSPYSTTKQLCFQQTQHEHLQLPLDSSTNAMNDNDAATDMQESGGGLTNPTSPSRTNRGVQRMKSGSRTMSAGRGMGMGPRRVGSFSNNNNGTLSRTAVPASSSGVAGPSTNSTNVVHRGVPERAHSANFGGNRNRVIMRSASTFSTNSNGVAIAGSAIAAPAVTGSSQRRAPPISRGVSKSFSGGIRPLTAGQMVNTPIERKVSGRMVGPGGTLQRTVSDISNSNSFDDTMHSMFSNNGEISLYTMDSINVRKGQQIIAEPLDDKSYLYNGEDDCSFADHESYVTRMTGDNFDSVLETISNRVSSSTVINSNKGVVGSKHITDRLNRMGITENVVSSNDDHSMASCLTNDFTDFGFDDYDDDDDDIHQVEQVDHADESGDDIAVYSDDHDDDEDYDRSDVDDTVGNQKFPQAE